MTDVQLHCFVLQQLGTSYGTRDAFALVHPVDNTFWMIPQATSLFSDSSVSWGRIAQCPTMSITTSFAKGQLDPLICRRRAVNKKDMQNL